MQVREQPIEPGQTQTTQNRIPITILELILKPEGEYFHCSADNIIYKDPLCKIPLAKTTRLQKDLKLKNESQVIPYLISQGYIIHSSLCEKCEQETLEWMAQA